MKTKHYIILMADIVSSRKSDQKMLMDNFKKVTDETNFSLKNDLLSPLTITLGDEFQGIAKNIESAVSMLFHIEENIIHKAYGFQLRFVVFEGEIDTPINKKIAYGMLGEGLTQAREALTQTKTSNSRFLFSLRNKPVSAALNNAIMIYQRMIDDWRVGKDYSLVSSFLNNPDYKKVADELGKTRSQIWKRKKSLKIEEYFAIKEIIKYITDESISHHSHHDH